MRLLLGLFALPAVFAAAQTPVQSAVQPASFCGRIQTLIADSPSHWGLSVTALDGTILCAVDAAQLFRPASNNKLFTTAAALAILGLDRTFETQVNGRFDAKTGVVKGDLTLLGGGDPNLDSGDLPYKPGHAPPPPFAFHDLEDLASELVAKGVKTVTGDVVGDDSRFPYDPLVPSWELEDVVSSDGAPISALTIADNQVRVTVAPSLDGKPALVDLDQHGVPFYTVQSQVATVPANGKTAIQIERLPGSRAIRVYGAIAANARPYENDIAMEDPAAYAALAFRQLLEAHGIRVRGNVRAAHRPVNGAEGFLANLREPLDFENAFLSGKSLATQTACFVKLADGPPLASHRSAALAEDVRYTLKVSQNLHAELLLRALALDPCEVGSISAGARMVRAFLLQAGVADGDFILYDGSGLSSHDLVTPRALTQLLVYAATQPWFDAFKNALPVGGADGSLSSRFTGDLKGKIFAKTGSLGESRALSGYLTAVSGTTVVFSVMDDNHPPASTADRTLMDRIVGAIAAAN